MRKFREQRQGVVVRKVAKRARLTLGLHPGAHQSQRVTGHLSTGGGQCHRRQTDQATRVLHVLA